MSFNNLDTIQYILFSIILWCNKFNYGYSKFIFVIKKIFLKVYTQFSLG